MIKTLDPCAFQWDGIADSRAPKPVECCAQCGLPKTHPRHTLPPTPADVTATEQRRFPDGDH